MQLEELHEAEKITVRDKSDTDKDALSEQVDAYYVEGTSEQVKGLIRDLEHDTSVFHSVSLAVEPANSVTNEYGLKVPAAVSDFGNGTLSFQFGSSGPSQPALKQAESGKAERSDAAAVDAFSPAPATELNIAGAKPSEDAGRAKQADGERTTGQDLAKSRRRRRMLYQRKRRLLTFGV